MLVNLVNPNKFNFYNIEVADKWGLECAVYFSTLLSLSGLNSIIVLDDIQRQIIKGITTLEVNKQLNFDKNLIALGILEKISENDIKINIENYVSLFNTEQEDIHKAMNKVIKKKRTKADILKDELKILINSTDSQIRDAYASWIDAVVTKQGWMSKKSVTLGQTVLDTYTKGDISKIIEILNIASINAYRDIEWAINIYETKQAKNKVKKSFNFSDNVKNDLNDVKNNVKLSADVF